MDGEKIMNFIKICLLFVVFFVLLGSFNVGCISNVNQEIIKDNFNDFGVLTDSDITDLVKEISDNSYDFSVLKNSATCRDMSELCGLSVPNDWQDNADFRFFDENFILPGHFDWNDPDYNYLNRKCTTDIRDQENCGSCWAFGTVGPLESAILIEEGVKEDLSEQWLVSCNTAGYGCNGGWWAHRWHGGSKGLCGGTGAVLETDFPYTANDDPCYGPYPHVYLLDDWAYVGSSSGVPNINSIKQAIYNYGPVSAGVYVDNFFRAYDSGIFERDAHNAINHAVVIVGWKDDDSVTNGGYWIVRNSWGEDWGENGYMRLAYDCYSIGYAACFIDGYERLMGGDQTISILFDYFTNEGEGFEDIDPVGFEKPEWYYRIKIGSEYDEKIQNLKTGQSSGFWPWNWKSEHTWDVNEEHIIYTENQLVNLRLELWDYDSLDADDLADINPLEIREFIGSYDLANDILKDKNGDIMQTSSGFYVIKGAANDNAEARFMVQDSYDIDDYKPILSVEGGLNFGNIKKGDSSERTIKIKNIAEQDPFNLNSDLVFTINNVPEWASVTPTTGSVVAGESKEIKVRVFTENLDRRGYSDNILIESNGGSKEIPISISVPKNNDYKDIFSMIINFFELKVRNLVLNIPFVDF